MSKEAFKAKAPIYMTKLMEDFPPLDVWGAAAAMGNLGYESGGLTNLQEDKPTVPGSLGGWGWAQWTGPRRRQFDAYVARNGLDPRSDEANYGMLWNELSGQPGFSNESKTIAAVNAASGLSAKVKAFENNFERAGIKNYASRDKWAIIAYDAYMAATKPATVEPLPIPIAQPDPAPKLVIGDILDDFMDENNLDEVAIIRRRKG